MRPPKSNNFKILDKIGLMYLTQLRVRVNALNRYKFDHNFNDTIDPMCSANNDVEDVNHFLLPCHLYSHIRIELLNSVSRTTGTNLAKGPSIFNCPVALGGYFEKSKKKSVHPELSEKMHTPPTLKWNSYPLNLLKRNPRTPSPNNWEKPSIYLKPITAPMFRPKPPTAK